METWLWKSKPELRSIVALRSFVACTVLLYECTCVDCSSAQYVQCTVQKCKYVLYSIQCTYMCVYSTWHYSTMSTVQYTQCYRTVYSVHCTLYSRDSLHFSRKDEGSVVDHGSSFAIWKDSNHIIITININNNSLLLWSFLCILKCKGLLNYSIKWSDFYLFIDFDESVSVGSLQSLQCWVVQYVQCTVLYVQYILCTVHSVVVTTDYNVTT